jgi:membrane associated rhomboid family serine protease
MVKKIDYDYKDIVSIKHDINDGSAGNPRIRTDFKLFMELFWELLVFFVMLIPYILGFCFSSLFGRKESAKRFIQKIVFEPFELSQKVLNWFFEAKVTSFLIFLLMFVYVVEVFWLGPYLEVLMSYQLHIFEGNYWSMLTSVFLHADLVHLLTNCLALLVFGRIVEMHVGYKLFPLFVVCGIISNVVSNMISYYQGELYYSLGASGAIAGIIMFAILFSPFSFTSVFLLPLPVFVVGWFLIFLDLIGLTSPSQTNHLAHLCGYGALLVLFFFLEIRHKKKIIAGLSLNVFLLIVFLYVSRTVGFNFLGLI